MDLTISRMTPALGLPAVLEHDTRADGPGTVAWLNKLKRAQSANAKGISVGDIAQACDGVPLRPLPSTPSRITFSQAGNLAMAVRLTHCARGSIHCLPLY